MFRMVVSAFTIWELRWNGRIASLYAVEMLHFETYSALRERVPLRRAPKSGIGWSDVAICCCLLINDTVDEPRCHFLPCRPALRHLLWRRRDSIKFSPLSRSSACRADLVSIPSCHEPVLPRRTNGLIGAAYSIRSVTRCSTVTKGTNSRSYTVVRPGDLVGLLLATHAGRGESAMLFVMVPS